MAAEEADEAKKDESKAEEETTYAEDDAEKAEIAEDVAEGDKDQAAEETPAEEVKEEPEAKGDGTAEALAAIGARLDAIESGLADRVAALEAFADAIRSEDDKEKGEMGLNRAEELRKEAQESYLDYRKRTIGV